MKKNLSLIIMIIISVLILVAMSVRDVAAQEVRDGEEPIFEIGFCITPTQDRNAGRDGDPIYGRNYFHVLDNVSAGSTATITITGYSEKFVDFGLEPIGENMYRISEGVGFLWAINSYEFMDVSQSYEVTIHSKTETIIIPSAFEAWKMYLDGNVDPCPDPWPVPQEYQVFLPVVFGQ